MLSLNQEGKTTKQRTAEAEPNRIQLRQHPNELTMKGKVQSWEDPVLRA